jgi:CDP-diacylglycerol--glycerol-3-phosphate 3-phosphatidyltransferase
VAEESSLMFTMPRALPRQVTMPMVGLLARLGVTPNMLTVAQLVGGIAAAYVIARGELAWGTGKVTRFGGVFDSTIDRIFEGAVLGGVLYYFLDRNDDLASMLVFVTLLGSLCVSYVRARAEAEGVSLYDGLFTRVVRIVLLTAGLVLADLLAVQWLTGVLWVLAVMTLVTTFHRLFAVWQRLRDTPPAPSP